MESQKTRVIQITHKIKEYALKGIVETLHGNPGESIFSEEWDQLIILDDCRFDFFEAGFRERNLPGKLGWKFSLGSWTGEFLIKNFPEEKYEDMVFITSNPFVDKYLSGKFHAIISVWKTGWDERYQTVPPRAVYDAAVKALKSYPGKKLIVHFLQPHHPYFVLKFGDRTMRVIRDSISEGRLKMDTVQNEPLNELYLSPIYGQFHIRKLIWAYRENLRAVMPYVELLLHRLRGRTVVTADHGELFGEQVTRLLPIKVYGHGIGRNANLIKVPWWVIDDEDREKLRSKKEITKEIASIEGRLGLRPKKDEGLLLKKAISRLKLKGRI
ncbi:hypothetical protein A3L11_03505 [Thermococcus siculi]|uniref:Sulfatase N-terminal domain-containing protein n=1 Tax=Thermococcus siculi TaxID=72803 RepID=A0A2Z2MRE1_9EURY|nr:hypothetical protein [Thermococcus siculi]ASJ08346.1 hypothetical protein A3L11_03505 [Thermococcus siculi]